MIVTLLALLAAGQADKPSTPAGAATLQQRFDTASETAATPGRCGEAVAQFEALEREGARKSPIVAAAIDVRKGRCFIALDRDAEGEAAIARGLPLLVAKGAAFALDVRDARLMLGESAYRRFDYDAAAAQYLAALEPSTGANRILPLLMLSRTLMFDHDGRALKYAEEARELVRATPNVAKRDLAKVQTQYARVLLNEGRDKEAYAELRDSLAKQGGLDLKVSLDDLATRSDLAIAALRNKDVEGARKYLAYTGAGRMKDAPFSRAAAMDLPACDAAAGLNPDDVAVVEFSLVEDGHVASVVPIFTTGRRASAIAFARAVSEWSWRAEDAKAVPPFFRYATRVELRCVRAPERPPVTSPLAEEGGSWFSANGADDTSWADLPAARAASAQRAAMQRAMPGGNKIAALHAKFALATNPVIDGKERDALLAQLPADASAVKAPASVRVLVGMSWRVDEQSSAYRERMRALLQEPEVLADPLAAATLRVSIARPYYKSPSPSDAYVLLTAVTDDPRLPAKHPLKVTAWLQRANLLAAANDQAGAREAFSRTGLTEEQCALVGLQPVLKRSGASSSDFPMEAMRWGFEGWVRTEFDVTADGRTATQRAVASYPPFIFDDAAIGIARDARFTSSFRAEGALACSGKQQSINFTIP